MKMSAKNISPFSASLSDFERDIRQLADDLEAAGN